MQVMKFIIDTARSVFIIGWFFNSYTVFKLKLPILFLFLNLLLIKFQNYLGLVLH